MWWPKNRKSGGPKTGQRSKTDLDALGLGCRRKRIPPAKARVVGRSQIISFVTSNIFNRQESYNLRYVPYIVSLSIYLKIRDYFAMDGIYRNFLNNQTDN